MGCLCLQGQLWAAASRKSAMTSSLLYHNSSKLSCPERGTDPVRITQQEHRQELNILDHTAPAFHTPAPTSQTCFQRRRAPDNTQNKAGVIPETDLKRESQREQVLMPKKESSGFSREGGSQGRPSEEVPSQLKGAPEGRMGWALCALLGVSQGLGSHPGLASSQSLSQGCHWAASSPSTCPGPPVLPDRAIRPRGIPAPEKLGTSNTSWECF